MSAQLKPADGLRHVASLDAVPHDRGLLIECGDAKILLVRAGEAVRAYGAECPHAGAPLNEGAVCNGRIICPWHKAAFAVETGGVVDPPALHALTRYDVNMQDNEVFLGAKLPAPENRQSGSL